MTSTTVAMMLEFAQGGVDVVECDEDIVSKINEVSYKEVDMGGMHPSSTLEKMLFQTKTKALIDKISKCKE